jgi:hypothetical protein
LADQALKPEQELALCPIFSRRQLPSVHGVLPLPLGPLSVHPKAALKGAPKGSHSPDAFNIRVNKSGEDLANEELNASRGFGITSLVSMARREGLEPPTF